MFIDIMLFIGAVVFIAGVFYRIIGGARASYEATGYTDTRPFEIGEELMAYIRRSGGFKQ